MPINTPAILQEMNEALKEWQAFCEKSKNHDCSDQPEHETIMVTNRLASTIDRLSPPRSFHKRSLEKILAKEGNPYIYHRPLAGALSALRREYKLGVIQSIEELVHADTFSSFMDMAGHLREQGYKDPAAVIAGTVLEQHLRELCKKYQISVENNGKHKRADLLNADLASKGVYNKLDQKNVTSWLGLRNYAAHGSYGKYTGEQVQFMVVSVRDFIARHPA